MHLCRIGAAATETVLSIDLKDSLLDFFVVLNQLAEKSMTRRRGT